MSEADIKADLARIEKQLARDWLRIGEHREMIEIPFTPDFSDNTARTRSHGLFPCIVCGRIIRNKNAKRVHVNSGFTHILSAEEYKNDAGDMGLWPVGPDCLKRHPEIKDYVHDSNPKKIDWKALYFDLYRESFGDVLDTEVMEDAAKRTQILSYAK